MRSTIASVNGVIDASKLPAIANDCVHMVVNNDPGLKAILASDASPQAKAERYLVMLTRSRFDVYPPINATPTGTHSAVFVPNRPAQVNGQHEGPAGLRLGHRREWRLPAQLCPDDFRRVRNCADHGRRILDSRQSARPVPRRRPSPSRTAQRRRQVAQQNHNPTVFKNLVFNTWYGHGLRAIDISIPQTPREVGYIMNVPHGIVRTYPVFKDGLIYWVDNKTGLHVAKYTGPRANELPGPGSGVYEGNATSPAPVTKRR